MSADKSIKRKYFALGDLFVALVVVLSLLLGLFSLFFEKTATDLVAVVTVKGEVYCEIPLSQITEPYELSVTGDKVVVLYMSSEYVRVLSSDCSDKLCVNTGRLTRAGQSSVCLPARVSVKLISEDVNSKETVDAIAG